MPADSRDVNPYASPLPDHSRPTVTAPHALQRELKSLRLLVVWLGVSWIVVGLAIVAFAAFLFLTPGIVPQYLFPIAGAIGAVGVIWVLLGSAACYKQITAVFAGLILSYLHLAACAFSLNICCGLVLLALVLHAHRVLHWAEALQLKGIPLTTRPQDIETRLNVPS